MADINTSIVALKADAQVNVSGNAVDGIEWLDGNPTNITNEAILAKQTELDAAEAAAVAQKATDKTNGNQMLLDLGLTQAELDALTGQ